MATEDNKYKISTINELMTSLTKTGNNKSIVIDNDLDFNNEDYYYHPNTFINTDSNPFTLYGQNNSFTNIYCINNCFMNIVATSNSQGYTFQDLTFEAVLNNTNFIITSSFSTYTLGDITFKNCIFNIKTLNSLEYIFNFSKTYSRNINFISCVFNVEIYTTTQHTYLFGTNFSDNNYKIMIESCEFKIKNKSGKNVTILKNTKSYTYQCVHIDNSAFFLQGDNPTTSLAETNFISGISSILTNSFFASFGERTNTFPISFSDATISCCFYDRDKIRLISDVTGLTGLTTEECKSKEKLDEIGFSYAGD